LQPLVAPTTGHDVSGGRPLRASDVRFRGQSGHPLGPDEYLLMTMRRREFITLTLAAGAVAWPAPAQQAKLPKIGFLGASTPANWSKWTSAFVQRLRELG